MKNTILLTALLFCIFACSNQTNNTSIAVITVNDVDPAVTIEEIYDSMEMIKLETTNTLLLSGISDIQVTDSNFYVLDDRRSVIAKFNRDGKYLKHINWTGKGPREYLSIYSMRIDPVTHKLVISDNFLNKIFILDTDMNLEKVIHTSFNPTEVIAIRNNRILNGQPIADQRGIEMLNNNVLVVDDQGAVVKGFIPLTVETQFSTTAPYRSLSHYNDRQIICQPTLSDTIYLINPSLESVSPLFYVDFQMKTKEKMDYTRFITEKKKSSEPTLFMLKKLEEANLTFNWGYTIASESNILVRFGNFDPLITLYDIDQKKSLTYEPSNIKGNPVMKFATQYPKTAHGSWYYSGLDCNTLKILADQETLDSTWSSKISQLKYEDNPVIFRYRVKAIK